MADYQSQITNSWAILALLGIVTLASLAYATAVGSADVPLNQIWHVLVGGGDAIQRQLILELRLPRALSAFGVGALLALAGALLQLLLRNPLADPYILGTAGGAATAALICMLAGLGGLWVTGGAFAGALLSVMLVFSLARVATATNSTRLLLTGVVVAAGWGAVISFLLIAGPTQNVQGMLFWLIGDLSRSTTPWPLLAVALAALLWSVYAGRALNVFVHGQRQAQALGVDVARLRLQLFFFAALLTATAVAAGGTIGFVGLIVPHLLRLLGARNQRVLLPACLLMGGSLLVLADTWARSLLAPQQLPVGVLTALIGVPLFLWLLRRTTLSP